MPLSISFSISTFALQVMLQNKDPGLKYINDGDAVVNPFAVDRKTQLADLMRMFCRLPV